jgi:hypothetical protein
VYTRIENIKPYSAIPRVKPIARALHRPAFAVPPPGGCADRTLFWKHNQALSAILWFKSQPMSLKAYLCRAESIKLPLKRTVTGRFSYNARPHSFRG